MFWKSAEEAVLEVLGMQTHFQKSKNNGNSHFENPHSLQRKYLRIW